MSTLKQLALQTFLLGALALPVYAGGGGGFTGGATEWTQLANNAELITSVAKQAEILQQNIKQLQAMYENLKNLDIIKSDASSSLKSLMDVVNQGQAIAYSSKQIDTQFNKQFMELKELLKLNYDPANHDQIQKQYEDWDKTNRDTITNALKAAGMQADQMTNETQALNQIQNQLNSSAGALQALQAGGSIAAAQVEQLQKLRQLVNTQIQLQSTTAGIMADTANKEKAFELMSKKKTINFDTEENRNSGINSKDFRF